MICFYLLIAQVSETQALRSRLATSNADLEAAEERATVLDSECRALRGSSAVPELIQELTQQLGERDRQVGALATCTVP